MHGTQQANRDTEADTEAGAVVDGPTDEGVGTNSEVLTTSTKSTATKALIIIVAIIVIVAIAAWLLSMVAVWLYDLTMGWWLDPILDMTESVLDDAYNTMYNVVDDIGTALGGTGFVSDDVFTVGENLVTGIVTTLGTVANDFVSWFYNLFAGLGTLG